MSPHDLLSTSTPTWLPRKPEEKRRGMEEDLANRVFSLLFLHVGEKTKFRGIRESGC